MLEEPQQGAQSTQSQAGRAHAAGTRAPRRRPSGTTLAYLMPSFHWAPVRSLTGTGLGGDLAEQAPGPAFPERQGGFLLSWGAGTAAALPPPPRLRELLCSRSVQGQPLRSLPTPQYTHTHWLSSALPALPVPKWPHLPGTLSLQPTMPSRQKTKEVPPEATRPAQA